MLVFKGIVEAARNKPEHQGTISVLSALASQHREACTDHRGQLDMHQMQCYMYLQVELLEKYTSISVGG